MSSESQINANRLNALSSTGPRTEEGKARSSRNSLKDGFYSKSFVILPGLEPEFEKLRTQLLDSLKPGDGIQQVLFEEILLSSWNLIRARVAEVQVYEQQSDPTIDPLVDDKNEAKLKRIRQFYRSNYTARETAIKRLSEVQTELRARLQAFPPDTPQPHNISVLARLRDVIKAMKEHEEFKTILSAKNEAKSPLTPEQRHELTAILTALAARASQSEPSPNAGLKG